MPADGPYKTVAMPPSDFVLLLTALEKMFDSFEHTTANNAKLTHIKDVHDFLRRTLQS